MMKHVKRDMAVLLLLIILWTLPISGTETIGVSSVYDTAALLTEAEVAEIEAAIRERTAELGMDIVIVTTANREYEGEDFLAETAYDDRSDLILLVILKSYGIYYYDLYTYGNACKRIKNTECDLVLDDPDVFDNLKSGTLLPGILAFVDIVSRAYAERVAYPMGQVIVGSAMIALVIAAIVCGVVIARYKMKIKPTNYPLEKYASLKLNASNDVFIGRHTLRRRIDSGSRGGGRSGGSRGGGHRGGR